MEGVGIPSPSSPSTPPRPLRSMRPPVPLRVPCQQDGEHASEGPALLGMMLSPSLLAVVDQIGEQKARFPVPQRFVRPARGPKKRSNEPTALILDSEALIRPVTPRFASVRETASTQVEPAICNFGLIKEETNKPSPRQKLRASKTKKTSRRREQCRANQARYRQRQKQKLENAEEKTAYLRELIGLLELQRTVMLSNRAPGIEYVHHIVTSFFHRFQQGFGSAHLSIAGSKSTPPWTSADCGGCNLALLQHVAFIRCVVSEDADFGGGLQGPETLLEQCWRYSALYSNLRMELLSIEEVGARDTEAERVTAVSRVVAVVTDQTLATIFRDLSPVLQRKLLGQRLVHNVHFDLEFAREGLSPLLQLVWANVRMDIPKVFMRVLGNAFEVEEVLRCSRMSMHGCIGDE